MSVETKSNFVAFELCTLIELSSFGNQQFRKGLSNMKILKDLVLVLERDKMAKNNIFFRLKSQSIFPFLNNMILIGKI